MFANFSAFLALYDTALNRAASIMGMLLQCRKTCSGKFRPNARLVGAEDHGGKKTLNFVRVLEAFHERFLYLADRHFRQVFVYFEGNQLADFRREPLAQEA